MGHSCPIIEIKEDSAWCHIWIRSQKVTWDMLENVDHIDGYEKKVLKQKSAE